VVEHAGADAVVLGLGNPGAEFEGSRHNLGAEVIATLGSRHNVGRLRRPTGQRALVGEIRIGDRRVVLAIPTTYMNESGAAAPALLRRYRVVDLSRLVVVHDELDLPPGRIKLKLGGGAAGHNGLRSLRQHLHSADFVRVRVGIGKPPSAGRGADYVLRRAPKAERALLEASVETAADAVELLVTEGLEAAMTRYNA
jgi:peptidyl-tRNA hydrolase, PTH1 family